MVRARLAIPVLAGLTLFGVGLYLTDEVTVIVGLLGLTAVVLGVTAPSQWGSSAIALAVGVGLHNLLPTRPYHPDPRHLARYGPSRPLPVPFGLTGHPLAEAVASAVILLAFVLVATGIGRGLRGSLD